MSLLNLSKLNVVIDGFTFEKCKRKKCYVHSTKSVMSVPLHMSLKKPVCFQIKVYGYLHIDCEL